MVEYLIERAIVVSLSPDSEHAYAKLSEAWERIETDADSSSDGIVADREDLEYLLERAIIAHKSPDSTHAYSKLEEAWERIVPKLGLLGYQ